MADEQEPSPIEVLALIALRAILLHLPAKTREVVLVEIDAGVGDPRVLPIRARSRTSRQLRDLWERLLPEWLSR